MKHPLRPSRFPAGLSRPVASPLHPSVVYASASVNDLHAQYEGRIDGYTYSREGHPNASQLAGLIDGMENAQGGMMTGSGMGAISAVLLGLLTAGDHVLGGNQLYGRALRMMTRDLPRFGIETSFADPTDPAALRAALRPNTRMIFVEVVSNPTLRVADMDAIRALAVETGARLVVDNTFTTPATFQPLDHGADIVLHSVTKMLAGHSDAMLGYVAARDPADAEAIWDMIVTMGLTASPYDCWMAERGLYTFDLRFERAQKTAARLADHLSGLPGVARVLYPGRPDHPDNARAMALLSGAGNMVSFDLHGGPEAAQRLSAALALPFAPTLGDIATTVSHAASSSHRGLSPQARADLGMSDGFFRVSVGIEPESHVLTALERAIAAAQG